MNCRLLALSETRSSLPPPSPFSLSLSTFLLHCSPVLPLILLSLYASFSFSFLLYYFSESLSAPPFHLLFFTVPPSFLLLHSLPVPLLPPWFPLLFSNFYSSLFNSLLFCHFSVCMYDFVSLFYSLALLYLSCPLICLFA